MVAVVVEEEGIRGLMSKKGVVYLPADKIGFERLLCFICRVYIIIHVLVTMSQ